MRRWKLKVQRLNFKPRQKFSENEFVTMKASSAKNTDVNNFQSFKFVIFKYPNEANGKTLSEEKWFNNWI